MVVKEWRMEGVRHRGKRPAVLKQKKRLLDRINRMDRMLPPGRKPDGNKPCS
jgi:hypothetical protein